ncbi:unnamed protein product [Schistosoma curassoni]|uniref:CCDC92 domain-containing protein n=1 Tax=Schistosoma curassoni TaxID=6186 RepID=A0A183L459_9TREM|nr:unnamed protein product [Schistosoma curassoni]
MFSPILGSRNQNFGVKVPYVQTNSGLNGSISVSPQRLITATDFLRLAETVRHLRCNQEALSQQISVLKSENQLLYPFAKEGRSASVCIGQTKRKALPSITPSGSRFQNKELKLDLRKGFQIERNSVQPLQLVQTSDLLGPHMRPKFDLRNLSAEIGNTSSGANITDQISDIGSVVHVLPSNLQLTGVNLGNDGKYVYSLTGSSQECDVNRQSLVDKNPANVQDEPRYYLSKDWCASIPATRIQPLPGKSYLLPSRGGGVVYENKRTKSERPAL